MKKIFKRLVPPIVQDIYKRIFRNYGWHGDYLTWDEAIKVSIGYDQKNIFEKVAQATKDVMEGKAAFERDSVLFQKPDYHWPVLSHLLYVFSEKKSLYVLDFGGALGSIYLQHRHYLKSLKPFSWTVVEQKHFVEYAKREIKDSTLTFAFSAREAASLQKPDLILFSSVLQYLENPKVLIQELLSLKSDYILIDRTPISDQRQTITLQKVSPEIYKASYPCWLFDEDILLSYFPGYELVSSFTNKDEGNFKGSFKGYFLKLKNYDC